MNEWLFLDYVERDSSPIWDGSTTSAVSHKGEGENSTYSLQLAGTVSWTRPLASNLDGYPEIVEVRIRLDEHTVQAARTEAPVRGNLRALSRA